MTEESTEVQSLPGSRLREQRERKELTLGQAASELHVNQALLKALEENRFDELGAPIFVKGHLRNYGRLIGLDVEELVAEYEAARQPAEPSLVAHRPDGPRMDQHRSHAWVGWFGWLFLLILAILLGGWWYYEQEGGGDLVIAPADERVTISDPVREPPSRQQQPAGDIGTGVDVDGQREPSAEDGTAGQEPVDAERDSVETVPELVEREAGPPAQTGGQEVSEPREPVRSTPDALSSVAQGLVLEFGEESWVEIYDAEGRPILYDLVAAGTRREINASGELRIFLGNSDGVEVFVDGERFNIERHRRRDSTARFTVNVPPAD